MLEIEDGLFIWLLTNGFFVWYMQEMSYNNYLDADAAWNCVSEFTHPTCVVVKHTNPCGVASRNDLVEAYRLAVEADPVSAFGGIVAFNVEVDEVNFFVLFDTQTSFLCGSLYLSFLEKMLMIGL